MNLLLKSKINGQDINEKTKSKLIQEKQIAEKTWLINKIETILTK
jgi:hypothetical protein